VCPPSGRPHLTGRAETVAHDDALSVAPGLEPLETADDGRQVLGEILDRALYDAGGF